MATFILAGHHSIEWRICDADLSYVNRVLLLRYFCHAQATKTDQALLSQVREKYDAPFTRNLQSFDRAVDFSWKQHFTETRRVGDEGTDEDSKRFFSRFETASR